MLTSGLPLLPLRFIGVSPLLLLAYIRENPGETLNTRHQRLWREPTRTTLERAHKCHSQAGMQQYKPYMYVHGRVRGDCWQSTIKD